MQTQVLPPTPEALAAAAALLREGRLVAFPTETVYGLGANALDPDAVRSIFAAKGRRADNPLIMHVWDAGQLEGLVTLPPLAETLMARFWPGPLTILMPRTARVPDVVTAGLSTVAVRMPSHPVAQALLKACGLPVAAPSANRSGKPSPTLAAHVLQDMDGVIPMIPDGGPCEVGLESTVLDITREGEPMILRPGGVTQEMLEAAIGPVTVAGSVLRPLREGEVARSPGMRYRHYAPEGQITLVTGTETETVAALARLCARARAGGLRACGMCFEEHAPALAACDPHVIGSRRDPGSVAGRLFDTLRRLDDEGIDVIYSEVLPPEGVGLAVMNRLGRAAAFRTVDARDVLRDSDPADGRDSAAPL